MSKELTWRELADALEKHKPNVSRMMSLAELTYITRDLNAALAEKPAERPASDILHDEKLLNWVTDKLGYVRSQLQFRKVRRYVERVMKIVLLDRAERPQLSAERVRYVVTDVLGAFKNISTDAERKGCANTIRQAESLLAMLTGVEEKVPPPNNIDESPTEWGRVLDPPIAMKQEEIGPFLKGIENPPEPPAAPPVPQGESVLLKYAKDLAMSVGGYFTLGQEGIAFLEERFFVQFAAIHREAERAALEALRKYSESYGEYDEKSYTGVYVERKLAQ